MIMKCIRCGCSYKKDGEWCSDLESLHYRKISIGYPILQYTIDSIDQKEGIYIYDYVVKNLSKMPFMTKQILNILLRRAIKDNYLYGKDSKLYLSGNIIDNEDILNSQIKMSKGAKFAFLSSDKKDLCVRYSKGLVNARTFYNNSIVDRVFVETTSHNYINYIPVENAWPLDTKKKNIFLEKISKDIGGGYGYAPERKTKNECYGKCIICGRFSGSDKLYSLCKDHREDKKHLDKLETYYNDLSDYYRYPLL